MQDINKEQSESENYLKINNKHLVIDKYGVVSTTDSKYFIKN